MSKIFAYPLLIATAIALSLSSVKSAEVEEVAIADQYGIAYLPLTIMKANKLFEKHLDASGLEDTVVTWSTFASGAPATDALLSGKLHIAAGGPAPFLVLWDKTRDTLGVKAIAGLSMMPMLLVTNDPNIKSIRDFTEEDRISLAGAGQSVQTRILQMASAEEFGEENYNKLAPLFQPLPHPDGLIAFLSGQVTAYMSSPPFQYQALREPGVHTVLSSYDVTDGPATFVLTWTTSEFRDQNPKTYKAFLEANREATEFINANKREAAEIFLRESGDSSSVDEILEMLEDPDIQITMTPSGTTIFSEFMFKVGLIDNRPESWKDLYFSDVHSLPGS